MIQVPETGANMTTAYTTLIAVLTLASIGAQPAAAQEMSRYRQYVLTSSLASVMTISGVRESAVRTTHERPAIIQELEWRTPYVSVAAAVPADPVRDVRFRFLDDQLYQVVVSYDRNRMEGLTRNDIIELLSATYGMPLLLDTRRAQASSSPVDSLPNATVVARWEDAESVLVLTQDLQASQWRLTLLSKRLAAKADAAVKEAVRLDAQEAPRRELDQRGKAEADAHIADEKARVTNRAAFRP
jgi:hypothetical protein